MKKVRAVSSVTGKTEYIAFGVIWMVQHADIPTASLPGKQQSRWSLEDLCCHTFWKLLWPRPKPTEKSQQICPAVGDALWSLSTSLSQHPDMQGDCSPLHSQSHFCSANLCPTEQQHRMSWEANLPLLMGRMTVYWWFKCFPPGSGWLSTLSRGKAHWFKRSSGKQFFPIQKTFLVPSVKSDSP